jgi:hypothetical protein
MGRGLGAVGERLAIIGACLWLPLKSPRMAIRIEELRPYRWKPPHAPNPCSPGLHTSATPMCMIGAIGCGSPGCPGAPAAARLGSGDERVEPRRGEVSL